MIIPLVNLLKLTNRDFSLFIHESASIESIRAIGLHGLIASIDSRKELMTHKDIFRIMTGLCRLDVIHNKGVLQTILQSFDERMRPLMAHELALMAVELSACTRRLGKNNCEETKISVLGIVDFIVDEFKRKIDSASPFDLANIVSCVADLGVCDPALMQMVAMSATLQVGLFKGPELADLLLGFCMLGIRVSGLFTCAIPQLTARMSLLHDQQLIRIVSIVAAHVKSGSDPLGGDAIVNFSEKVVHELESRSLQQVSDGWEGFQDSIRVLDVETRVPRTLRLVERKSKLLTCT